MRAPPPKTRAVWPLLLAALGVLFGLALSRPASAADACSRDVRQSLPRSTTSGSLSRAASAFSSTQQIIGLTAALALQEETPGPILRGPVAARDREARLVDLDHGQCAERAAGRDPHARPDSAGAQRRDSGASPREAILHPRWPAPDLACSGVAAEVLNRAARASEARRGARVRGVHASRGPPKPPAGG